jgi:hypothetical protein
VFRAPLEWQSLDKHVRIPLPDPIAFSGILRAHLGQDLEGPDLRPAAASAHGGTGADAERWVCGARRLARNAGRAVRLDDLHAEIREARAVIPRDVQNRVSYHETRTRSVQSYLELALRTVSL